MAILFISNLVPDKEEYWNSAFTRSGQNVMRGIADSLSDEKNVELLSCQPLPSFPKGPLFVKGNLDKTESGHQIHMLPTLNLLFIKNFVWGIMAFLYIIKWAKRFSSEDRNILVYNIYTPIVSLLYKAAKKSKSKIFVILYDLGVPPKRLNLGKLKMFGYKQFEKIAYKYIPKLDGRIVINENMVKEYAPDKDFILIDGGVNDEIVKRLFPLKVLPGKTVTYVLAGMLWDQNGTKLILDALKLVPELDVKVIFAGRGQDVELIKEQSLSDSRIQYVGMLSMDELFKVYESADVLLNLRMEEEEDMHFPSKLLEYLVMGKYVVSTPVAHAERVYGSYMKILHDITPQGLANVFLNIDQMSKESMLTIGISAREFMLKNRTWKIRTNEILEYIHSKS